MPPDLLTNAELARLVDTSDAWITERTGIKERHILRRVLGLAYAAGRCVVAGRPAQSRMSGPAHLRNHDAGLAVSLNGQFDLRHGGVRNIGSFDVQAACRDFSTR